MYRVWRMPDKMPELHFLNQACLSHCFRVCLVQAKVYATLFSPVSRIPPLEAKQLEQSASIGYDFTGTSQAFSLSQTTGTFRGTFRHFA